MWGTVLFFRYDIGLWKLILIHICIQILTAKKLKTSPVVEMNFENVIDVYISTVWFGLCTML